MPEGKREYPADIMAVASDVASMVTDCGCDNCQAGSAETIAKALLAERQRDRWEAVSSAPHACHVVASYFDHSGGEWVYAIVMSPPISSVWTHWQTLPAPPSSTEER